MDNKAQVAAASSTLGMSFHSLRQEEYDGRDKKQMINKKSLFSPPVPCPLFLPSFWRRNVWRSGRRSRGRSAQLVCSNEEEEEEEEEEGEGDEDGVMAPSPVLPPPPVRPSVRG